MEISKIAKFDIKIYEEFYIFILFLKYLETILFISNNIVLLDNYLLFIKGYLENILLDIKIIGK